MYQVWHIRQIIHEPVRHRLCPDLRRQPTLSRSWQGWQFIYKLVGHRLCPGTQQHPHGAGYVGVGISNANQLVTSCVPAPGSDQPGPGVCGVSNSYVGCFGLAPPRDPCRRGCPRSGVSASASTAPVTIGISFCTPLVPEQTYEAGEHSSQFPRFRRQPGHLLFPPYYLPRRTVSDSSSYFWSSNFWSKHTLFQIDPVVLCI